MITTKRSPSFSEKPRQIDAADDDSVAFRAAADAGNVESKTTNGAAQQYAKAFAVAESLGRENAHLELKRRCDELQSILAMKNELVSGVVHDLKSPIGAICFSAQMLRDQGIRAPDPRGELIKLIIESCESVLAFIDERLGESASSAQIEHLHLARVDLVEVVHANVQLNMPAAARKRIELELDFSDDPTEIVMADHRALSRVLSNLVSNAIKFSPYGRPVRIRIDRDGATRQMRVSVRDRGPGLTTDDRKHLFTAYHRLSARPTGGESSTGLGLSIAHELMQKMGGEIGCDPRPHGGTCFWIALPLA